MIRTLFKDFINDLLDGLRTDNKVMDEEYKKLLDKGVNPLTLDKFNKI